jgi:hypothetical protein
MCYTSQGRGVTGEIIGFIRFTWIRGYKGLMVMSYKSLVLKRIWI